MIHDWKDFPKDINRRPFRIYEEKGLVNVDGFRRFKLADLNKIPLDVRLSFPPHLFQAIHAAGKQGKERVKP